MEVRQLPVPIMHKKHSPVWMMLFVSQIAKIIQTILSVIVGVKTWQIPTMHYMLNENDNFARGGIIWIVIIINIIIINIITIISGQYGGPGLGSRTLGHMATAFESLPSLSCMVTEVTFSYSSFRYNPPPPHHHHHHYHHNHHPHHHHCYHLHPNGWLHRFSLF